MKGDCLMTITSPKIRKLQRKLYLASKQKREYRFYSLYDKICRMDILEDAYKKSKANRGAAGVDGVSFDDIECNGVAPFLAKLSEELKSMEYRPLPIRRVLIPKSNGKKRPLGIAAIRDRVVATACKIVIEPIFEADLYQDSYGYRPKKQAQEAVSKIDRLIKGGYVHVYDADLSNYFDTIPHQELMTKLMNRVTDNKLLTLIRKMLKSPIQVTEENGKSRFVGSKVGVPQGNVLSALLANVYLNEFCLTIANYTPCKIITYADDFVIMHKEPFTSKQCDWFKNQLESMKLSINDEKTKVVDISKMGSSFEFLGFSFKKIKGFYRDTVYVKIQPSKKSQEKLKNAIRDIVKHRTGRKLEQLIRKINPILRGWKNYFCKVGNPKQVFFMIDWFVVARFYRWYKRLSQRSGKYLTQNAWKKLKAKGLNLLQPTMPKDVVKGVR
jgi:RNA-directed DNA polymerase